VRDVIVPKSDMERLVKSVFMTG